MSSKGTLYLIPMTLGDSSISSVIPQDVLEIIKNTNHFIVENIRTTRRYLKKIDSEINIDNLTFFVDSIFCISKDRSWFQKTS